MTYTPPAGDEVDFELSLFTPPQGDEVDFELGEDTTSNIYLKVYHNSSWVTTGFKYYHGGSFKTPLAKLYINGNWKEITQ